ncbi:MAG TPA: hypothetical protein VN577_16185 [Terriglobales bacterium]|nr:hypothetical protein [Terriglobales bacterium]
MIDDNDFPYQSLFEKDGYTLEKWADVDDLSKLESGYFDLLLLDLQGVGRQQSNEQGLGILRHLRQSAPALVIIAYSSADWPLKYQEFFRLADAVLSKSSDYVDFKRKVDELLQQRFSLGFYLGRIKTIVGVIDDVQKLEKVAQDAILRNKPNMLRKFLESRVVNSQAVSNAISVVQIAVSIASLWKN